MHGNRLVNDFGPSIDAGASPSLRDRFLDALDGGDHALQCDIARHLRSCTNVLPSSTCVLLGVPVGSTYAVGAQEVMKRDVGKME